MEKYNALIELVETIKIDAAKFYDKENNAAGTRLRKGLKEIADMAKGLRKDVSAVREERKTAE